MLSKSFFTYFAGRMLLPFVQEASRLTGFVMRGVKFGQFVHQSQFNSQQTPIFSHRIDGIQQLAQNLSGQSRDGADVQICAWFQNRSNLRERENFEL